MNEHRSTTPPVPPPGAPDSLQPNQPSHFDPTNDMNAYEDSDEPNALDLKQEIKMEANRQSKLPRPANGKNPEPPRVVQVSHRQTNKSDESAPGSAAYATNLGLDREKSRTPSTPGGCLVPFDWDELETRFERAMADANQDEEALMTEFTELVKFFNIWAATASAHDNERAAKRLQTRTQFVKLKEADFTAKKQSYEQVVAAFQSAMQMLSRAQN